MKSNVQVQVGNYAIKGCYIYNLGTKYRGQAFYGKASPTEVAAQKRIYGETSRPAGYDCKTAQTTTPAPSKGAIETWLWDSDPSANEWGSMKYCVKGYAA